MLTNNTRTLGAVARAPRSRGWTGEPRKDTDPSLALPANAVVYLVHQGYTFLFLVAAGGFDGPQMQWTEGERQPTEVAPTFAALVDAELRSQEMTHREWHERGGYYRTLYERGAAGRRIPR